MVKYRRDTVLWSIDVYFSGQRRVFESGSLVAAEGWLSKADTSKSQTWRSEL